MASFVFNPRSDSGSGGTSAELVELVELVEDIGRIDATNASQNAVIATQDTAIAGIKAYTDGLQPKITATTTALALNADVVNIATDPAVNQVVNISGIGDTVNINPSTLNLGTLGTTQVNIGTGGAPNIINLGGAGDTVNIAGTLVVIDTTNTATTDKIVTLNRGGGLGTGLNSGFEVEEAGVGAGYIKTSGDRLAWLTKAPGSVNEISLNDITTSSNRLNLLDTHIGQTTTSLTLGGVADTAVNIATLGGNVITTIGNNALDLLFINATATSAISLATPVLHGLGGILNIGTLGGSRAATINIATDPVNPQTVNIGTGTGLSTIQMGAFGDTVTLQGGITNIATESSGIQTVNIGTGTGGTLMNLGFNNSDLVTIAGSLIVNTIDMTPTVGIATGNWFRVRTTGNFTISFRRYGDLVFWSIPPIMDVVNPINVINNATARFDYFEFTGLIPVGFRPLASSNRSLSAVTVWNGNAVTDAFNLAYVNMISNGLIVVNLPNDQTFQNGRLAGWHTTLQGSYRIV